MTRNEAVAIIQEQLSFRQDQDAAIIRYLQLAQTTLEKDRSLPWWLRSERSYIYTIVGEQRIGVPGDFLREEEGAQLTYIPTDTTVQRVLLDKDYVDQLEAMYTSTLGPPEAYALDGKYFRLFPTPDAVYRIELIYTKKDAILDTNIENLWLTHLPLLLMGMAGSFMATALRDMSAAQVFAGWIQSGRSLLLTENEARENTNMDPQIGGPH